MRYTLFEDRHDELILIARVLSMGLFVIFGWSKLTGFPGTVAFMASQGLPLPTAAALIAVVMEFFAGIAVIIGFFTRPVALLTAVYTLATALTGHHYWTMLDGERMENMINFYKNVSIVGGLLLLSVTGAGKYSLDRRLAVTL
jgi:putative oxidoreductase